MRLYELLNERRQRDKSGYRRWEAQTDPPDGVFGAGVVGVVGAVALAANAQRERQAKAARERQNEERQRQMIIEQDARFARFRAAGRRLRDQQAVRRGGREIQVEETPPGEDEVVSESGRECNYKFRYFDGCMGKEDPLDMGEITRNPLCLMGTCYDGTVPVYNEVSYPDASPLYKWVADGNRKVPHTNANAAWLTPENMKARQLRLDAELAK